MAQRELFLFDVGQDRVADVTERRGQIVSGLMKAIRLQREEDAAYWMLALLRGGQDRAYLGRRCFGSACEDNFNLQAIEMGSELAKRPPKAELPYLQSVIASSRGPKWYWPMAKTYTLGRCEAYEGTRIFGETDRKGNYVVSNEDLEEMCRVSLRKQEFVPFFVAYKELKRERQRNIGLLNELVQVGKASPIPEAKRLAVAMAPHVWQCARRETNPVWQLVWILCHGPFPNTGDPVDLTGADQTIAAAEARWAKPELEPVPSWALDGVHVKGNDERFAGTWIGLRNMVAMFAKFGRLAPEDDGVLIQTGTVVTSRRKGMWPIIVPSMTRPGEEYEVDLDGDELRCSCPAYSWQSRKGRYECQHIRDVLARNPGILGG